MNGLSTPCPHISTRILKNLTHSVTKHHMSYTLLASEETITRTSAALTAHNFIPVVVATAQEALAKVKELIPEGASINNGASRTLEQIGFADLLKSGEHNWNNLHETTLAETDSSKQGLLRKQHSVSDYYLGSVHAVTETGELFIASATGSQLPALAYNAQNLILVVGTQKIVPTLVEALDRLKAHILPLEEENMQQKYGMGTLHAKTLILHQEHPMMQRKVYVVLVKEELGF